MSYCLNQLNSKLNLLITTTLVFLSVGFFLPFQAIAQQPETPRLVELSFVKTSSEQSSDSLYFNVLKIQNLTDQAQNLTLELQLPNALLSMTAIPTTLSLKPKGRSNIAFRLSVSKNANSNQNYPLVAVVKNSSGQILAQSAASVRIRIYRAWELIPPVAELNVIAGNDGLTTFGVSLRNNGNVPEKIALKLTAPEGYLIKVDRRTIEQLNVDLKAASDTVLNFSLVYKGKGVPARSQHQIQVTAGNALGEFRQSIRVNSYSNRFEYVQEKINLDNFVEVSHQVNLPDVQNRESFQTRGKVPFAKEGREIQYSFMNYDLTNQNDFWERSYYNLNYAVKK